MLNDPSPNPAGVPASDSPYIIREDDGRGGVLWKIPRSKSKGLLFFGIIWCTFTLFMTVSIAASFFGGEMPEGNVPTWVVIPFGGVFWSVGIGMLYAGFRTRFSRHELRIADDRVTLKRELFGRITEKFLDARNIQAVSEKTFYTENHRAVTGIELRAERGKIRFGSGLGQEEKERLIGEIKRVLRGNKEPSAPAPSPYFSIPVPKSGAKLWSLAIVFLVMGVALLLIGQYALPKLKGVSHLNVWMTFATIFTCLGVAGTLALIMTVGRETVLEGDQTQLAIRTKKHGLVLKERAYARSEISEIRLSRTGVQVNGRDMMRVELVVNGSTDVLMKWMEQSQAEDFASEVRRALGLREY